MKSIINPWFIYLAGACDEIREVLGLLFVIAFIPCVCIVVIYFLSFMDDELDIFRSTKYIEFLKKINDVINITNYFSLYFHYRINNKNHNRIFL